MQIYLIGIRNSPDHRSVRNIEVNFVRIYSLGPRFIVRCRCERESVLYRLFLKKIYANFVGTLVTVRNREVAVLERFDCRRKKKKNSFSKKKQKTKNKSLLVWTWS